MARIIVRCQYTGNYIFTGVDADRCPHTSGGLVYCPYCAANHVWVGAEAKVEAPRNKPVVRQAS